MMVGKRKSLAAGLARGFVRVGRTGRMGREGVAFTFVTPEEGNELTRIEMRINRQLKRDELADFASFAKAQPAAETPPPPKPVIPLSRPILRC